MRTRLINFNFDSRRSEALAAPGRVTRRVHEAAAVRGPCDRRPSNGAVAAHFAVLI